MSSYADAARQLAQRIRLTVRDMQGDFGDATNPTGYADLLSENLHPASASGGHLYTAAYYALIDPG